jgi:hypothetical protein
MAGEVVGPMSGQSTPPLLAQRAPQLCQQISATVIGVIRDLVRPQRYEPRQVARAAIGVSCGGRRHFAIRHAGKDRMPWKPGDKSAVMHQSGRNV